MTKGVLTHSAPVSARLRPRTSRQSRSARRSSTASTATPRTLTSASKSGPATPLSAIARRHLASCARSRAGPGSSPTSMRPWTFRTTKGAPNWAWQGTYSLVRRIEPLHGEFVTRAIGAHRQGAPLFHKAPSNIDPTHRSPAAGAPKRSPVRNLALMEGGARPPPCPPHGNSGSGAAALSLLLPIPYLRFAGAGIQKVPGVFGAIRPCVFLFRTRVIAASNLRP